MRVMDEQTDGRGSHQRMQRGHDRIGDVSIDKLSTIQMIQSAGGWPPPRAERGRRCWLLAVVARALPAEASSASG